MKKRSILHNPKFERKISVKAEVSGGLLTEAWRSRVKGFYRSIIPSNCDVSEQIWLMTPEDVIDFYEKIKTENYNFSLIKYVCICDTIADIYDIIDFLTCLRKRLPENAKIIYSNFNWKWALFFRLSGFLRFSRKRKFGDFYREQDLDCFFEMTGWENVKKIRRYILPFKIPVIGKIFDNFLVRLPLLNWFALSTFFIARKSHTTYSGEYSVSVLIPCKNEAANIDAVVKRMPAFGQRVEIVFINDKSSDDTTGKIKENQEMFPQKNILLVQGKGEGKGAAVREGMKFATGDICMILDADLSVAPEDLPQFYETMKMHRADFVHGTRFVYAHEYGALRFANIIGNIVFSVIFSYILDQRTTDTLCGTKTFWRGDWPLFEETRLILGDRDIWGDYNLIFGAARYGLKTAQLPVRYFERLHGITKMDKRIKNGLIMLKVAWQALWRVKFID